MPMNLMIHEPITILFYSHKCGHYYIFSSFFYRSLDVDDKCEFAYETLGTIEVQRGHLKKAIELFEKAIPLANTELEMGHLYGLRDAAIAQTTVSTRLGISLPGMMG